jgi:hypothetical protein
MSIAQDKEKRIKIQQQFRRFCNAQDKIPNDVLFPQA